MSSKDSISTPSTPNPRLSGPQFIGHLPRAEEDAMQTFIELSDNVYQYKTLGLSRQTEEGLTCDCSYEPGVDDPYVACGDGSDCINRLTQVECLEEDCHCRSHCQNQRFQRKLYSSLHIVKTDMKGFGLRASADIPKDSFIYEYIGEVVSHPSFAKRMREYAEAGIKHFYFMMLQKDEFIDATKKGGIGRFANHSCNPNCFVAKWTVGKKVRMGIFSKRDIKKDEEVTFNYNVDRYGHDAQPCYCGEAKCVGFIGGKTQTDIAAMDDVVLDALGMTEDVELLGLKGNKKKKGKKLDEDFTPIMKPLAEKDVPKVLQALRNTSNRKLLIKLLTRIKMTEDPVALRQLMRLRGLSQLNTILSDWTRDVEICLVIVESLISWPLMSRNKLVDSKIEEPVKRCLDMGNEALKEGTEKLIEKWEPLEIAYRIPKRACANSMYQEETDKDEEALVTAEPEQAHADRPIKRVRFGEQETSSTFSIKPLVKTTNDVPSSTKSTPPPSTPMVEMRSTKPTKEAIAAIIAAATAGGSATKPDSTASNGNSENGKKPSSESSGKAKATKEQRLIKLVGPVVVKCMSKYQGQMDHELFKKHAKQLTHLIAEKEKKSSSYEKSKLDSLPDEKKDKIKKFVKDYIAKVLRKLKATKSKMNGHDAKNGKHPPTEAKSANGSNENHSPENPAEDAVSIDGDELLPDENGIAIEADGDMGDDDCVEEDPWEPDRQSDLRQSSMDVVETQ
ncbi:hypothetical protein BU17DRAFT_51508 [Hysterangium stoloniferum]|nr:hypothetical protein BU17DRAFT_51508 [Hysterangium stoloniferum]